MSDNLDLLAFARMTEAEARAFLEAERWPNGPVCPHCGVVNEAGRVTSAADTENKVRDGLYFCRPCRKPFTVTVGTIFEGSHIPLSKWLIGFYLFASSKKSLSALQLQRQLGLGSYRTAWHMAHRIRFTMQNDPAPAPLTGDVELDDTYLNGKPRHKLTSAQAAKRRRERERTASVLVSRDGKARARASKRVTLDETTQFLRANVDRTKSRLLTDEAAMFTHIGRGFAGGHETVNHSEREYARGDVHTNTVESFHGLFKRAVHGSWHNISLEHMGRYLDEQCFRWSNRDVGDGERARRALGRVEGVRLYYRKPKGEAASGGEGLVAGREPDAS